MAEHEFQGGNEAPIRERTLEEKINHLITQVAILQAQVTQLQRRVKAIRAER